MYFSMEHNILTARHQNETIRIEAWGRNALRVRVTQNAQFTEDNKALLPVEASAQISEEERSARITNGKISCFISENGWIEFHRADKLLLKEYCRDFSNANEHSPSMKFNAREFKPVCGSDYAVTARFEAQDGEKIYGMGQYQQPELDLKGCILELAQRNSQISIPFYLSSRGYGFLWNHAGIGEVMFGANYT